LVTFSDLVNFLGVELLYFLALDEGSIQGFHERFVFSCCENNTAAAEELVVFGDADGNIEPILKPFVRQISLQWINVVIGH
jgi:hypothetical protein